MKMTVLSSLAFVVLSISVLIGTTISAPPDCPPRVYCPWYDSDDDGDIDIFDVVDFADRYGTTGTPMNKTDMLEALSKVDNLTDRVEVLEQNVTDLDARVEYLEGLCPIAGLPPPDYDSGWTNLTQETTIFTHNLNTTELLVYLIGKSPDAPWLIHQMLYGNLGARWQRLTTTTIDVYRAPTDPAWPEARMMLWIIP